MKECACNPETNSQFLACGVDEMNESESTIGRKVDDIISVKDSEISRLSHRSGDRIRVIKDCLKEIDQDLDYLSTTDWTPCNVRHALRTYKHILSEVVK